MRRTSEVRHPRIFSLHLSNPLHHTRREMFWLSLKRRGSYSCNDMFVAPHTTVTYNSSHTVTLCGPYRMLCSSTAMHCMLYTRPSSVVDNSLFLSEQGEPVFWWAEIESLFLSQCLSPWVSFWTFTGLKMNLLKKNTCSTIYDTTFIHFDYILVVCEEGSNITQLFRG